MLSVCTTRCVRMVRSRYMSIGRQLDNERFRGSSFTRRKVNDAAVLGRNVGERMFQQARIKKFRSIPRRRVFPLGLKQTSRAGQYSFSAHDKPGGNTTKKTESGTTRGGDKNNEQGKRGTAASDLAIGGSLVCFSKSSPAVF